MPPRAAAASGIVAAVGPRGVSRAGHHHPDRPVNFRRTGKRSPEPQPGRAGLAQAADALLVESFHGHPLIPRDGPLHDVPGVCLSALGHRV